MVERLHRQLKDSLKARTTSPHWMEHLPFTLLGLRTTWREEPGCSPAELVYGSTLHIPSEFIDPTPPLSLQPSTTFFRDLQKSIHETLPPPPTHHSSLTSYYPLFLGHTGFVYVRIDKHKTPLQRPYKDPTQPYSTSEKFFTLDVNGQTENISVDRLKTAYLAAGRYPPQLNNQEEEDISTPSSSSPLPNKSPGITQWTISSTTATYCQRLYRWYTRVAQQRWGGAMWRPINWRARKTHVTRDVGAQACVKTLTMIFANVRAVFVRAFIIKSALLKTGHVSRSQTVCLVSKHYNTFYKTTY